MFLFFRKCIGVLSFHTIQYTCTIVVILARSVGHTVVQHMNLSGIYTLLVYLHITAEYYYMCHDGEFSHPFTVVLETLKVVKKRVLKAFMTLEWCYYVGTHNFNSLN